MSWMRFANLSRAHNWLIISVKSGKGLCIAWYMAQGGALLSNKTYGLRD